MAPKQNVTNSFSKKEGVIHIGGIDALVRLTLDQVRTDARRGLKTGMFISRYRGSPLRMLDAALLKQQKMLVEHNIKFVDGINEDLAATAVWGRQMLHAVGKQKFDGVTGVWYGKAPGVDRGGDALNTPTTPASARTAGSSPWSATTRAASRRRSAASRSRSLQFDLSSFWRQRPHHNSV
jgi:indolepyruvate ferredoxin oxidoreductase